MLTLKEKAVLRGRDKFLRPPAVIVIITGVAAGQSDDRGVMEVVVPERVQTVAAGLARLDETDFLGLVLCDQNERTFARCLARSFGDGRENVFLRAVENTLRRIETT